MVHSRASARADADKVRGCDAAQVAAVRLPACCRLTLLSQHLIQNYWTCPRSWLDKSTCSHDALTGLQTQDQSAAHWRAKAVAMLPNYAARETHLRGRATPQLGHLLLLPDLLHSPNQPCWTSGTADSRTHGCFYFADKPSHGIWSSVPRQMPEDVCWPLMLCRPLCTARLCICTASALLYMLLAVCKDDCSRRDGCHLLDIPCRLQLTRLGTGG